MSSDHYLALGVRPDASPEDLRAAYLRVMRANHPDRRPGDPVAADVARRANAAYQVLSDASRRERPTRPGVARAGTPAPTADALRAAARARRAYSGRQLAYRRDFTRACFRVGSAIVVLGTAILLSVA